MIFNSVYNLLLQNCPLRNNCKISNEENLLLIFMVSSSAASDALHLPVYTDIIVGLLNNFPKREI